MSHAPLSKKRTVMWMETGVGIRCAARRRNFEERCTKRRMAARRTPARLRDSWTPGPWMWPTSRERRSRPPNCAATWTNCPARGPWGGTSRSGLCMIRGNAICITSSLPRMPCRSDTSKYAMRVSATIWTGKRVSLRSARPTKSFYLR